jgi:hypothetical protein
MPGAKMIPGMFNESLTYPLGMRPASYVDLDADLYSSTRPRCARVDVR